MNWRDQQGWIALAGSVIAILAPLVARQYLVAGLVLLATMSAALWVLWRRSRARFAYHELNHTLEFTDSIGHVVEWEKEAVVTPLKDGITEWVDDDLDCDGILEVLDTSPGRLVSPGERGTRLEPTTIFDAPLLRGKRVHKKLRLRVLDSFLTSDADFRWWIAKGSDFGMLRVIVKLPATKPCLGVPTVSYRQHSSAHRVGEGAVSPDGSEIRFEVSKPRTGVQYEFRWRW